MTKTELKKFQIILLNKQAELEAMLRNHDAIAIQKSPDALDETQFAAERDLAIHSINHESNLLRNVRSSLDRIAEGSFGTCIHCEADIAPNRLKAVPWAAYCIHCQEIADRKELKEGVAA